eukprot:7468697-Alexandrium_andersonii.AAC.1
MLLSSGLGSQRPATQTCAVPPSASPATSSCLPTPKRTSEALSTPGTRMAPEHSVPTSGATS